MPRTARNPIDAHVWGRVKLRRGLLSMSQTALANKLGITFQQVQKYEKGANRIGASRLYQISEILNVPVEFFFKDVSDVAGGSGRGLRESTELYTHFDAFVRSSVGIDLCKSYVAIENPEVRKQVLLLVKSLSKPDSN